MMRLQDKILKAKQAIRAAGFSSGQFKPSGSSLRVDVIVPVTFDDLDMSQDKLVDHLGRVISELVKTSPLDLQSSALGLEPLPNLEPLPDLEPSTISCPYDLRTAKGKAWKQGRLAGATA